MTNTEAIAARSAGIKEAWQKHIKYVHTPETDALIRHAYHLYSDYNNGNALQSTATKLGWPKWVVIRRGRSLGLSRTREGPWTSAEEELLEKWGFLSLGRIALKLRQAGFKRTETAIHLKMKRLRIRAGLDGYSMRKLAEAFGIDDHKVALWVKRNQLKPIRTGITVGQNEKLYFSHGEIRRFILHNPEEIDLAKCEKLWLLDIVSGGRLCEQFRQEVA
jgi:hypothetical protein